MGVPRWIARPGAQSSPSGCRATVKLLQGIGDLDRDAECAGHRAAPLARRLQLGTPAGGSGWHTWEDDLIAGLGDLA
jgi:hypothetical protein